MKRTHVHLTARQMAQLQSLSKDSGLSMAELVRRAVDDFLMRTPVPHSAPVDKTDSGASMESIGAARNDR